MQDIIFQKFPHYPHYSSSTSKPPPQPLSAEGLRSHRPSPPAMATLRASVGAPVGHRRSRRSSPPAMATPRTSVASSRTCCQLLLCIKAPDSRDTKVDIGLKYEAHLEEVLSLLRV
ncbi:hypothetical protein GUJ93_ZPchr0009g1742 [Zizania palustris]|uniref:Uncharacterized protein n=1 Tax=Zizania palustris TaxID=103762 RepID=A0A8J5V2S3_ZIZPA|nr:hypothetical protein GUJ93_ZPchr0009g1742 [Zizania palustris]